MLWRRPYMGKCKLAALNAWRTWTRGPNASTRTKTRPRRPRHASQRSIRCTLAAKQPAHNCTCSLPTPSTHTMPESRMQCLRAPRLLQQLALAQPERPTPKLRRGAVRLPPPHRQTKLGDELRLTGPATKPLECARTRCTDRRTCAPNQLRPIPTEASSPPTRRRRGTTQKSKEDNAS